MSAANHAVKPSARKRLFFRFLLVGFLGASGIAFVALSHFAKYESTYSKASIDVATAAELTEAADRLMRESSVADKDISNSDWPAAIRALDPRSPRIRSEGLYILIRSQFVREWGFFVLREGSDFKPQRGTDPSFEHLYGRVYKYRVEG